MKKSIQYRSVIASISRSLDYLEIECAWTDEIENEYITLSNRMNKLFAIVKQMKAPESAANWTLKNIAEYNRLDRLAQTI